MNTKKTFIITGGNSGLDFQCAKNIALQSQNNCIIIAGRNESKLAEATEKIIAANCAINRSNARNAQFGGNIGKNTCRIYDKRKV